MKKIITFTLLLISVLAIAGGRNDQVKYPEGYKDSFTHYNTQNRANNKQIADMYANEIAINSVKSGTLQRSLAPECLISGRTEATSKEGGEATYTPHLTETLTSPTT